MAWAVLIWIVGFSEPRLQIIAQFHAFLFIVMTQKVKTSTASKIKSMYQSGLTELSYEELEELSLIPGDDLFIAPNLLLEKQYMFKLYTIRLSDTKKDPDGKLLDEHVDYKSIISALNDFKISKKTLKDSNEITLNKSLERHFRKYFVNAHMSSGKQRSYFDLVIGNMNHVIEIKLARALKSTSQMQKAIGQIGGYKSEIKNNNLILLVIGEISDTQDKNILHIQNYVEKDLSCKFYFLEAN